MYKYINLTLCYIKSVITCKCLHFSEPIFFLTNIQLLLKKKLTVSFFKFFISKIEIKFVN